MAVTRVQESDSFDGSVTWSSTPTAGNLLTVSCAKTGGFLAQFTAPSGWSTAINSDDPNSDIAIFYKIADGTETTDSVGNANGTDRYWFSEWAPGSGRRWKTTGTVADSDIVFGDGVTSNVLAALSYSGDGVALLAHAPSGATSGESVNSGYSVDVEVIRMHASQVVSGSGTIASTTVSWTGTVQASTGHAVFVTEASGGSSASVTASAVACTVAVLAASVTAGGGVEVTPSSVSVAVAAPAVSVDAAIAVDVVPPSYAFTVPTAEVSATEDFPFTAPVTSVAVSVPAPASVAGNVSVSPGPVAVAPVVELPASVTGEDVTAVSAPRVAATVSLPLASPWVSASADTIDALLDVRPRPYVGHRLGVYDSTFTDWYLSVEVALPSTDGVLGVGTLGDTLTLGRTEWTDITDDVRGLEWRRGSDEPFGRPRIGELRFTLDNRDDAWNPFPSSTQVAPAYFAPGTLVRVSVHSPNRAVMGGWLPQFTGIVDSWEQATRGAGADALVEVSAFETLRFVSNIDDNALASVVGLGDDAGERVDRLLEAAGWPYGSAVVDAENLRYPPDVASNFWDLQSTDMSQNRLAELYLAADSSDVVVRSGRDGRAVVYAPYYFGYTDTPDAAVWPLAEWSWSDPTGGSGASVKIPGLGFDWAEHRETNTFADGLYVPYDADSLDVANDDLFLTNDVRYARSGGTQQTHEQLQSIKRYGRRTLARSDLQTRFDNPVLFIAAVTGARRGLNTLRVENMDISTSDRGSDVYLAMLAADIGVEAFVYGPDATTSLDRPRIRGFVRSMVHRVEPRTPTRGVTWRTSVAVDTWTVQGLPAAQLTDTPLVLP